MSEVDDRFMKLITAMAAMGQAATGGAESQIHTQEAITVRTRFTLQLAHGLGLFIAFIGSLGGLFLFTAGLDWLFELGWDARFYLMAWVLALLLVAGVVTLYRRVMARFGEEVVPVVQAFAVVAILLLLGLAVSSLLLTTRERFGWELAWMVVGAGLLLACPAFGYNQAMDLLNPYWRRSPYEQAITRHLLPPLADLLAGMDSGAATGEVRQEDPRWNQRVGGKYGVVARPVDIRDPSAEDWDAYEDDEPRELISIEPEAGNLIWFVRYAARLPDLTIDSLTLKGASPMLPFEERGKDDRAKPRRLRRDMIRRLLARGSTSDEVRVAGVIERGMGAGGFWHLRGQGATAEWAMEQDEAKQKAELMWREVYGDQLPVPDYWRDRGNGRKAA